MYVRNQRFVIDLGQNSLHHDDEGGLERHDDEGGQKDNNSLPVGLAVH